MDAHHHFPSGQHGTYHPLSGALPSCEMIPHFPHSLPMTKLQSHLALPKMEGTFSAELQVDSISHDVNLHV